MDQRQRLSSGAAPVLFAMFMFLMAICMGCSSPSDPSTPSTDSGAAVSDASDAAVVQDTSDSFAPDTFPDSGNDISIDADADVSPETKPGCKQGETCTNLGEWCGTLLCAECGTIKTWQNVPSECDAGSDASDSEIDDADAPDDADASDAFDAGDMGVDTTPPPDATPPDTGSGDTGVVDTGPGDTGASDTADSTAPDTGSKETASDSIASDTFDSGPGDTGTPKDSVVADTSDADTAEAPPPKPLKCTTPVRDELFDKEVKISGGDVEDVGRILAFTSSIYVPVRRGGTGAVAGWNGVKWALESFPITPSAPGEIWGTSDTNLWYASEASFAGIILHKVGTTWTKDSSAPAAKRFGSIVGVSASEFFVLGSDPSWYPTVWRGDGSKWTALPALPEVTEFAPVQLYAPGMGRVVLIGYEEDSSSGVPKGVAVYVYDGSWTKHQAPLTENFVLAGGIHGTSLDEMWIAGRTNETPTRGKVCKFSKLTTWTCYVSSGTTSATKANLFGSVFSPWTGAAIAGGSIDPIGPGVARIMTIDAFTSKPEANAIDSIAPGAGAITHAPSTKAYFLNHGGKPGSPGGFYRFTCD